MTRIVIVSSVIVSLLIVVAGCSTGDTSRGYLLPKRTGYAEPSGTAELGAAGGVVKSNDEMVLVEQVVKSRREYRESLQLLVKYYTSAGDNRRLNWAKEELLGLERMPQYRYVIEAMAPENLKASAHIPEADTLYQDAVTTQRMAQPVGPYVLQDEEKLRIALEKYSQLIQRYPTSDRIADAAYRSAEIYESFGDYETAVLFYKRTFEWNPATTYPARFNAAQLLDNKLGRRDQALPLYQEAVTKEASYAGNKAVAERRIKELTGAKD